MKGIGSYVQFKDWLYVIITINLLSELCIHGARHSKNHQGRSQLRIVNGTTAEPHEFPYQLLLLVDTGDIIRRCGASLISPGYVLTAAHCIITENNNGRVITVSPKDIVVLAGKHDRTKTEETEKEFSVSKVIKHFEYQDLLFGDDLALLKVTRPISFNQYIQPIQMASPSFKATGMVLVSGWGQIGGGKSSKVLRKVFVPLMSNAECARLWKYGPTPVDINSKQICAGFTTSIKDACHGDSGGPLVKVVGKTKILVGVVSFGSEDCATPKHPGIYSSISKYRDWIDYNIKK